MKKCKKDCQFLSEYDLWGKEPELYFKGKTKRTTKLGKALSYFYLAIYIAFFFYKIIRMLQKVDITFYETYAYSGIPSIKLSNDFFYGGFSLNGIIDPTLYFPVVYFIEKHRENGEMILEESSKKIDIEICQLEKFGEKYKEIFKNKDLEHSYCLKDVDEITLEGYSYLDSFKYLNVAFMPCVGYAPDGRQCKSEEEVTNFFLKGVQLNFNIEDVELTPHIYDTPSQPIEKDITGPGFLTLYEQVYAYFQIVILETEQNLIGFDVFSNIETQQFLKYDEVFMITAPSPHSQGLQASIPIVEVIIQLSSKVLTQKRQNTKLIELLGDVGGVMEVVWSCFNIIATLIADILYDKALINNLFSFDLDKKIIEIKKNKSKKKNDYIELEDSLQIYNNKNLMNNIFSGTKHNYIASNDLIKNDLNEDFIKNKEVKTKEIDVKNKKKKKKIKGKLNISISSMSNKYIKKNNLKNRNKNSILIHSKDTNKFIIGNSMSSFDKILNKENKNRSIINKIKMNCCCIYFWFCFARKKKNVQNILLDEGMGIIVENLDIMNIFKKIYNINKIEESLKVNEIIDMSDICKRKLNDLIRSKLKSK